MQVLHFPPSYGAILNHSRLCGTRMTFAAMMNVMSLCSPQSAEWVRRSKRMVFICLLVSWWEAESGVDPHRTGDASQRVLPKSLSRSRILRAGLTQTVIHSDYAGAR